MAARYWVGGGSSANWDATGNTNWGTASNTRDNASVPTTGDSVIFDNSANGNSPCTLNVSTAVLASADFSAYANTLTHAAAVNLNVGGSLTMGSSMTYTLGNATTSATVLSATGTFTPAAKTFGNVTFNGSGQTFTIAGNLATGSTATVTLTQGTLKTDGAADASGLTHSWGIFSSSNSNTRTLTLGNSTINVTGASTTAWNLDGNNITLTANTATINGTGASANYAFGTAGTNYSGTTINITGTGSHEFFVNSTTVTNFTMTGSASKTNTFKFNGNWTVSGTFTITGNSATNRPLFHAATLGTAKTFTLTGATISVNNVDFRDITFARTDAGDLDLSNGGANSVGDCGGNTRTGGTGIVTFTTAANQHWISASGGNWSDVTKWTSRVPLPQDNVYFDNAFSASQTVTADMPRLGKSIDWTGASGSPTWADSVANTLYGSLTLISGMTHTFNDGTTYEGRGTHTITSAGKSFSGVDVIQAFGGTYTLQDAYTKTANNFRFLNGTLNTNGFTLTLTSQFDTATSNTRVLNLGASTISFSGTGTTWNMGATGMTLSAGTSTILISDTSASSKTFAGGGLTYNDLKIAGGGAGAVIITGANTFNRIYTDGGGTKSITLPGSTTTTIASTQGLANGTNVITFTASSGTATVAKSGGGTVGWDYVSLTNIAASTANTWYAGTHSTDGGGNTNWIFTNPPPSSSVGTGRANRIAVGVMI